MERIQAILIGLKSEACLRLSNRGKRTDIVADLGDGRLIGMNELDSSSSPQIPNDVLGYISRPRETIQCELKGWIDPTEDRERARIAKTCLAMRNANGGVLLIGVSDSGEKLSVPEGFEPAANFTQDVIQLIVSSYAARVFDIDVHHHIDSDHHVVAIVIPSGTQSPVTAKRDFAHESGPNIKLGTIYARTLKSNGTISTAAAAQEDLERITDLCFDNRTADIGKFLRRHLIKENIDSMRDAFQVESQPHGKSESSILSKFKAESFAKLRNLLAEKK